MWRFEHSLWLLAGVALPLLGLLGYWLKQRRDRELLKFARPEKLRALLGKAGDQAVPPKYFWYAALAFMVLSLSNLQLGTEEDSVTSKGSNVVVALDLSNSMLARDIGPDRLERSKRLVSSLAGKLSGDRIAFIVFAGRAYIQMPFTTDYGAFEMHLRSVNTEIMPTQGTALGEAISLAMAMPGAAGQKEKVMILLSDGEDHDSEALALARKAAGQNMIIHTIGVGTEAGAPIPVRTGAGIAYKRDMQGNEVMTRLNEENLRKIAKAGGGKYFNINEEKAALREISKSIRWATGAAGEERIYRRYKSYFQWFLFPAIVLLMLELWGGISLPVLKKRTAAGVTLLMVRAMTACIRPSNPDEYQAAELFGKGEYQAAIDLYKQMVQADSSARNLYNLGTAYFMLEKVDSMADYYDLAIQKDADAALKSKMYFNSSIIYYRYGAYKEAAEGFGEALKEMPGNYRAQYNLCMALEHLPPRDEPPPQKDQKDQQDQQNDDQQQEDQKQQNQQDKRDQDKQDQKKEQESKDRKEQPEKGDDKKEPAKPQAGKMSQQELKQLFDALNRQEKAVQKKVLEKSAERSGQPYVEKDW